MHRRQGSDGWVHWMGKVYTDKAAADRHIEKLRESQAFFRWGREYSIQRQPINAEWESVNG